MASKNASTEDIEEALNQTRPRNIEVKQDNNNSTTMVRQQPINTINSIKFMKLLNKMANQKIQIESLQKDVNELKKYIKTPVLTLLKRIFRKD